MQDKNGDGGYHYCVTTVTINFNNSIFVLPMLGTVTADGKKKLFLFKLKNKISLKIC